MESGRRYRLPLSGFHGDRGSTGLSAVLPAFEQPVQPVKPRSPWFPENAWRAANTTLLGFEVEIGVEPGKNGKLTLASRKGTSYSQNSRISRVPRAQTSRCTRATHLCSLEGFETRRMLGERTAQGSVGGSPIPEKCLTSGQPRVALAARQFRKMLGERPTQGSLGGSPISEKCLASRQNYSFAASRFGPWNRVHHSQNRTLAGLRRAVAGRTVR